MTVVCNFSCKYNKEGFCAKEKLSIRMCGNPPIPVCETFAPLYNNGVIRYNEYSLRTDPYPMTILLAEEREEESEQEDVANESTNKESEENPS